MAIYSPFADTAPINRTKHAPTNDGEIKSTVQTEPSGPDDGGTKNNASSSSCAIKDEEEDPNRPPMVSPAVWASVFPPDRITVKAKASWLYRKGVNPDVAVKRANYDIWKDSVTESDTTGKYHDDLRAVCSKLPDNKSSEYAVLFAAVNIWRTAVRSGPTILSSETPSEAAWENRTWHARTDRCLLTGDPLDPDCLRFGKDGVNKVYSDMFMAVKELWCQLVVSEAKRQRANDQEILAQSAVWNEGVDPDDAGTWGDVAIEELTFILHQKEAKHSTSEVESQQSGKSEGSVSFLDIVADTNEYGEILLPNNV